MPVNKRNMRLWVAALRSGTFIQGQGMLKFGTLDGIFKYCCLGVACEVAMADGLELRVTRDGLRYSFDDQGSVLPIEVALWLGVHENPALSENSASPDGVNRAVLANDTLGWSFDQIADALVSYYKLDEDDGDNGPGTD
jgi:hypothetical protein